MKHIHITLVGGQPMPPYLGIIDLHPDKVILIYSPETSAEAQRIVSLCNGIDAETVLMNPVNINQIEQEITSLEKRLHHERVTINLTGGTKPWSLLFYSIFQKHPNAQFFYIDQNNVMTDLDTHQSHPLGQIDRILQFKLYGTPLQKFRSLTEYTDEDWQVCRKIMRARAFNYQSFNSLTIVLHKKEKDYIEANIEGEITRDHGQSISWDKSNHQVTLTLVNRKRGQKTFEFASPNVMSLMFFAGWFEFLIAKSLSYNLHIIKMWINCEFSSKSNNTKNEVDIIADLGTKLLFVECKTQINKVNDIDKFHSVLKNYGGMGSKGLFVTHSPLSQIAIEKCKDNGITHFHFDHQKDFNTNTEALNNIVNEMIMSINPR